MRVGAFEPWPQRALISGIAATGAVLAGSVRGPRRAAAVGLTAAACYEPLRRLVREQRSRETEDFRDVARQLLTAVYAALPEDDPDLDRSLVGLHAFVVQYPLPPRSEPYLGAVARFRLGPKPGSSGIVWRQGVGAIGECWRTGQPVVVEMGDDQATAQEWEADPDAALGLSYEEYLRLCAYYGAVLAVPVLGDGRVVGVLALDYVPGAAPGRLAQPDALGPLQEAASIMADVLQAAGPDVYPGPGVASAARLLLRALRLRAPRRAPVEDQT